MVGEEPLIEYFLSDTSATRDFSRCAREITCTPNEAKKRTKRTHENMNQSLLVHDIYSKPVAARIKWYFCKDTSEEDEEHRSSIAADFFFFTAKYICIRLYARVWIWWLWKYIECSSCFTCRNFCRGMKPDNLCKTKSLIFVTLFCLCSSQEIAIFMS